MQKRFIAPLAALALVYLAFLACDLFVPGSAALSSALKYAGLVLCLLIALLARPKGAAPSSLPWQIWAFTVLALVLTLAADLFLLFTHHHAPGVAIFCCAQLVWLRRVTPSRRAAAVPQPRLFLPAAGCTAIVFGLCALFLLGAQNALLYTLSAWYAVLILTVTACTFCSHLPQPGKRLAQAGMVLFLLCDICVVVFNLAPAGSLLYRMAAPLMWLFYLPAQALLALSARVPSRRPPVS